MSKEITIIVKWPSGEENTVSIDQLSQTKEVIDRIYPPNTLLLYPFLLMNGRILDLTLTLKGQDINDGDTLVIYEHNSTFLNNNQFNSTYSLEHKLDRQQELLNHKRMQILKTNDIIFSKIEGSLQEQEIYQELLRQHAKDYESHNMLHNHQNHFHSTVIPQKPSQINNQPLPISFPINSLDEMSDDGSDSNLDSFQQTHIITKQPCHEWSW